MKELHICRATVNFGNYVITVNFTVVWIDYRFHEASNASVLGFYVAIVLLVKMMTDPHSKLI